MNRIDFMKQLESLLQNIAPAEREEALQYYNDYFDDAGAENEQEVVEALGNPAKVAENIKRDLFGNGYGEDSAGKVQASDRVLMKYGQDDLAEADSGFDDHVTNPSGKTVMPAWAIALLVILVILASPVGVGLLVGVLAVLLGVVISWFVVIFSVGVTSASLIIVLLILIVVGIICLFVDPWVGVSLIGGAMLCGGIGILLLMLTVAMAGIVTPAICKGIASLFRRKSVKGVN